MATENIHATKTRTLIGVDIGLLCLSTTFVALRFLARRIARAGLWYDDYAIAAALPLAWVPAIMNLIGQSPAKARNARFAPSNIRNHSNPQRLRQTRPSRPARCNREMVSLPLYIREFLRPRDCHGESLYPPLLRAHLSSSKCLVPAMLVRNGCDCILVVDHLPVRRHFRMHADTLFLGEKAGDGTLHRYPVLLSGPGDSQHRDRWDFTGAAVADDMGITFAEGAEDGAEWGVFVGKFVRILPTCATIDSQVHADKVF